MFGLGKKKKKKSSDAPAKKAGKAHPKKKRAHVLPLEGAELPAFHPVAMKAMREIRGGEKSPSEIADTISADPGLSVRVLRTVNSAAFALRKEVTSVGHAVALLGLGRLESVLISVAVKDALPQRCFRGFEPGRFWRTAVKRAALAQELAGLLHPATRMECFTWGLLVDLAVPLLAQHHTATYGRVLERWHGGEGELHALEQESFGWTHAEVGGQVCRAWELPAPLTGAVEDHHLDTGEETRCPPAVQLAAILCESPEHSGIERLVQVAAARYGIPEPVSQQILSTAEEKAARLASLFAS